MRRSTTGRTRLAVPVAVLALTGTSAGCASSPAVVEDPVDAGRPPPRQVPAATGPVTTRPPTTPLVLDDGSGPVVCLGEVEDSEPPQCPAGAVPLAGWDWAQARASRQGGGSRWGRYSVSGTFDGTTLTVTDAVPAARYDTARPAPVELPPPGTPFTADALDGIVEDLADLPGVLAVSSDDAGHVLAEVVHDDGTLQAWADERYSDDVVVLTSALVPAG